MLKSFISYYAPYKKLFFMDMLAAFMVAIIDLVYPMITRNIINDAVPNRNIRMIFVFCIILLVIFIIKAGLNYFIQYYGHVVGVRMQGDMRRKVFKHLQKLPNEYFSNNKTGAIMSRIVNDLMEISELAHHGPEDVFVSLVMFVGSFTLLCRINVLLAIIIFAFVPVIVVFSIIKRRKMSSAFRETRIKTGDVNAVIENSISGIRVTRSFVNEKSELNKFDNSNDMFREAREYAYKKMGEFFSGTFFLVDMLELIALIASAVFTFNGYITIGDFVAYVLYVKMFIQPIRKLINFSDQFQNGMSGFQRFEELLKVETEKESKDAKELKNVNGEIIIDNVTFRYESNNEEVFNGFNLKIDAGKTVALVGPSGGGKTTICSLIPRFYDVCDGSIKIDGIDIREVTLDSLRRNIGIVSQEVFLFTGSIRDNIIIGKPDATDEEVMDACIKARIHDFIMSLKDGYDTFVGERGLKLSGGQKQRISIARVFLKDPKIMILDEATSALDNITEREIQESLEELSRGRTNIIVAHRLSTIQNADEILLIGKSGIVERGTHNELIDKGGVYKSLYSTV
ncbi:ABC transporter ATP-binding protein [Candidatus Arthromitus sp. SFB-mouse-Japan]|uniref:ABC transporter ATP-binding protein n=1 Tax=Candidatus Arthromitus sp. SFB-mouse TaxID=49118 RepID=UPI00021B7F3E|nr:ABC transporter ATP-binding protein [Candidatus Arthromitus sp. SFB-mouse]EGX28409.1 ABC transporter, ATP-binding protein/permease protein [Candidatus Arthromitus sp. SFB-mouse-NYU]EIA29269.1 ABC transporter, ATP-binding protein/permease protein [Candidatus Arthromitus sp. SFB-co]EIA29931.1 ABC transporter, ATP-binding protein/permease protein [Candidatus Arthromitus sp. SFB-mouse-SU]BAK56902.1 ABC transporter ATP-binding protein [Candidatus Arthromitus sp. SFB-mouse-Japan]